MSTAVSQAGVTQVDPSNPAALAEFVALERRLIGHHPRYYANEVDADVRQRLAGKSPIFDESEFALFTAPGQPPVARCVAFLNRRYQRHTPENSARGFIGYFAAAADAGPAVTQLLERAEGWLRERGVKRVVAPLNGSSMVGMAALTDGFDEEPMFPFTWNPPYYRNYFEQAGYAPGFPLWQFWIDFATPQYRAAARKAAESFGARVRHVEKRHWKRDIEIIRTLFNECFADEWEMHELNEKEWRGFLDFMKPRFDVNQLLIAEVDGEPAGFCLGMPDYTPHYRAFNGRMGLMQILKFMVTARRYKRAGLLGIGVRKKFRGRGIGAALATRLYRHYESNGMRGAFYYLVNDSNAASRRFAINLGGQGRIQYHCFEKKF